eukprot:gene606-2032_t
MQQKAVQAQAQQNTWEVAALVVDRPPKAADGVELSLRDEDTKA